MKIQNFHSVSVLFVPLFHIRIPLGNIKVPRKGLPQVVLLGEFSDRKVQPVRFGSLYASGFVKREFLFLLEHQENVSVQSGTFRGARASIFGYDVAGSDVVSFDVADQPVVDLENQF